MNSELNFSPNFEGLVLGCTSYGARPQARAVNLSLTILDEVKVCELADWLAGWVGRRDGRRMKADGRTEDGRVKSKKA